MFTIVAASVKKKLFDAYPGDINAVKKLICLPACPPLQIAEVADLCEALYFLMTQNLAGDDLVEKRKSLFSRKHIIVSMGAKGVLWYSGLLRNAESGSLLFRHFPAIPLPVSETQSKGDVRLVTNGAGDAFLGGFVAAVLRGSSDENDAIINDNIESYHDAIVCGLDAARVRIMKNYSRF